MATGADIDAAIDADSESAATRKRLGAWYTPASLVDVVVDAVVTDAFVGARGGRPITVLDPACGDGRFLAAVERRVAKLGGDVELVGVDLDAQAVERARRALPNAHIALDDALARRWPSATFDLVIGNPPFLSPLAAATQFGSRGRGGASGPYADAAVRFLALAAELVEPAGGRLAMVLPQSVLSSRDASAVRAAIDDRATMCWSQWTGERLFDAQVLTCVVALEFGVPSGAGGDWSAVITGRIGVPSLPEGLAVAGCLGDRAQLNANFRDEYYGMAPAVSDDGDGPRLITSGLIDPGTTSWGRRSITFAKQRYASPRLILDRLDERMLRWARRRLVAKVLVANQTSIIEAVCDPDGEWLPGVPVVAVYPSGTHWDDDQQRLWDDDASDGLTAPARAWEIAAVLTSPVASAWLWHRHAGTGMSATTVRASPQVLAHLPWPAGGLEAAVDALQAGDVRACGAAVDTAYGVGDRDLHAWWEAHLQRIEARQPGARA